jgi:galactokinase
MREDFEISVDALDVTVEAALSAGALGARMVGGGFGGCVIALCRDEDEVDIRERVQSAYEERNWKAATFSKPRPSAGAHEVLAGER